MCVFYLEISVKTINNDTYKYTVEPSLPVRELKLLVQVRL